MVMWLNLASNIVFYGPLEKLEKLGTEYFVLRVRQIDGVC
jgi:hypothetical protein